MDNNFVKRAISFLSNKELDSGIATEKTEESLANDLYVTRKLLEESDYRAEIGNSNVSTEETRTSDIQGLKKKRVPIKELQLLYLNNQFINRGVNVRADEATTRGYEINGGDDIGQMKCSQLINNSGGSQLFWQWSVNTDVAGDGCLYKVRNKDNTKFLELRPTNPLNFNFLTDIDNKIIIDEKTRYPKSYMQVISNADSSTKELDKNPVPLNDVVHLRFNTFSDEFTGISSLQSVYRTTLSLMNMERAAAESAVKTANPAWIVKTSSKSTKDISSWAKILHNISGKEVTFLPQGMDVELKSPGNQNFNAYADYFLDAVVAALGVPKAILTGSGGSSSGNRSTVRELSRHFYSVIRINQRKMERLINDVFIEYAEMAGFKAPVFKFVDIAEDADATGERAMQLFQAGIITIDEARQVIGLDTSDSIKKELLNAGVVPTTGTTKKASPDTKADLKTWHNNTMSPQAGNKSKMRADPTSEFKG